MRLASPPERAQARSGVVEQLLGGWQLAGSLYKSSGSPFSLLDTGRPRHELVQRYFNTAAFASPATGSFGNSARNLLVGPGFFTINLATLKDFRLSSQQRLGRIQFRAEVFNLLNWVNVAMCRRALTSWLGTRDVPTTRRPAGNVAVADLLSKFLAEHGLDKR